MAFYPIAKVIDLYDGCKVAVQVGRIPLLLVQWEGRVVIIEDRCPHMDARLVTGVLAGGAITCRAHGIAFDLASGQAQGPLADTLDCLQHFTPVYDGHWVGVDL